MRRLFLLLILPACSPGQFLQIPPLAAEGSALVLLNGSEGGPRLFAVAPEQAVEQAPTFEDDEAWALVYGERSLAALGLEVGPLSLDLSEDSGRPLPEGFAVHHQPLGAPVFVEERDASSLDMILGSRPLFDPPKSQCTGPDPCQRYLGEGDETYCEASCAFPQPDPPTPPTAAALPNFGECPSGWNRVDLSASLEGLSTCEAPERQPTCEAGFMQAAGDAGCRLLGSCAAGRFQQLNENAIYVDPDAAAGGTGTEASPLTTIAAAMAAATNGELIALSQGQHNLGAAVDGHRFVGACARDTEILTTNAVALNINDGEFTGLRIGGQATELQVRGQTTLEDIEVNLRQRPLHIIGTVAASNVRVRGGSTGGVFVVGGGQLTWSSGSIEGAYGAGLFAGDGTIMAEDVAIERVIQNGSISGLGVGCTGGSTVQFDRGRINNPDDVHAFANWCQLSLSDLNIEGGRSSAGRNHSSLSGTQDGVIVAKRVFGRDLVNGIRADNGSQLMIEDFVVLYSIEHGATVLPGGVVEVDRSVFIEDRNGFHISSDPFGTNSAAGAQLTLRDVHVINPRFYGVNVDFPRNCGANDALSPATQVERLLVRNPGKDGVRLFATKPGTSSWSDVRVENAARIGFLTAIDSAAAIARLEIDGAQKAGLWIEQNRLDLIVGPSFGISAPVYDLKVSDSKLGVVLSGTQIDGQRWLVENSGRTGLLLIGNEGRIQHLEVAGVGTESREPLTSTRERCRIEEEPGYAIGCLGSGSELREQGTAVQHCGSINGLRRPLYEDFVELDVAVLRDFEGIGASAHTYGVPRWRRMGIQSDSPNATGFVATQALDLKTSASTEIRFRGQLQPVVIQ